MSDAPAMRAWTAAVDMAAGVARVRVDAIVAETGRGGRRPEREELARRLAVHLAVVGGGAEKKPLARVSGLNLATIKYMLWQVELERDAKPDIDGLLTSLERRLGARLAEPRRPAHELCA